MNSHYAIPGLYNNDQHVTGPRHLGLRCEGTRGTRGEAGLFYTASLPLCLGHALAKTDPRSKSVCVSPIAGSCHCNFSPHCPLPTPPRLLDGQDLLLSVRLISVTQVIGNRLSYWIRFPNLQYAGSNNQSQITWAG